MVQTLNYTNELSCLHGCTRDLYENEMNDFSKSQFHPSTSFIWCVCVYILVRNAPDCVLRHHVYHSQWLQPSSGLCWAWGGGGPTGRPGAGAWGLPLRWAAHHFCLPGHPDPEPCAHCRLLSRGKMKCATVTAAHHVSISLRVHFTL